MGPLPPGPEGASHPVGAIRSIQPIGWPGADTLGPTELRGLSVTSPVDLRGRWGGGAALMEEESSEPSLEVGKILTGWNSEEDKW